MAVARVHERRATGRRGAIPGVVVRGSVRLITAVVSKQQSFSAEELRPSDYQRWRALRTDLQQGEETRRQQWRFRKNPLAYLAALEAQLLMCSLPFSGFFKPLPQVHWLVWLYRLVALSMLFVLAACGSTTTSNAVDPSGGNPTPAPTPRLTATNPTVTITTNSDGSFAFSPTTLTIKAGTTVIWMNTTAAPHTVTSDDGKSFDSDTANPITPQSGTYHFTFATVGTFAYHCTFHPYMKATIVVTS